MSTAFTGAFLWLAVLWPLLLAMPVLHSRLPWSRFLAIIPAALLAFFAADGSQSLSWLLFGTELAIDSDGRWILATSVAVWIVAATVIKGSNRSPASDNLTTLFLLTMAGNLGVVLAVDLVAFFCFSTLMGYGFYGLMIYGGDEQVRRAGRLYLICLVVADLALFEALLLAASTTEDLQFSAVHQAMAEAPSVQLYLGMVVAAFVLKAGIWPFSLWLSSSFQSMPQSRILLGAVPVAMGLYGMVRWLPLGEGTFSEWGMMIQILGVAAVLYAMLRLFSHPHIKLFPAYGTMIDSGLFIATLGMLLTHPAIWDEYGYLAYPYVAVSMVFLAALTMITSRLQDKHEPRDVVFQRVEGVSLWAGRQFGVVQRWTNVDLPSFQSLLCVSWLKAARQLQRTPDWQKLEECVDGWGARITMFVLLGLLLAWLA